MASRSLLLFWLSLILSLNVLGFPTRNQASSLVSQPRPLVIWHGLGDSYASPGILEFISLVKRMYPGIFVHSVYLDKNLQEDQRATYYGNVNEQVSQVAQELANITELARGFDAMGFSQGGQFLRAYVQRYNSPPIHNLITFGSQHMGISDIPGCRPLDVACQLARRAAQGGVYSEWAQENLIQAQYYRDPARLEKYLATNRFLADINNEVPDTANSTYADNLKLLNNLVLVLFLKDQTVVPKESSWFGSYAVPSEGQETSLAGEKTIVPMRLQPLYVEDWIGLRALDERGGVILETCEGEHMRLGDCWEPLAERFVGAPIEDDDSRGVPDALLVQ